MTLNLSLGKLTQALSKFQGEVEDVYKDKQGFGYTYADLAGVLQIVRPLLAKYELSVMQLCCNGIKADGTVDYDVIGVETILSHISGEYASSKVYMRVQDKKGLTGAQAAGSVITYARRYALAAILGIAQTDTDAAAATESRALLTVEQLEILQQKMIETDSMPEAICKYAGVKQVGDITATQFPGILKLLNAKQKKMQQAASVAQLAHNKGNEGVASEP